MTINYESWESLYGKTLKEVKEDNGDTFLLTFTDGTRLELYHKQECCEIVYITGYVFSQRITNTFSSYYNKRLISINEDCVSEETSYGSQTKSIFTFKWEYDEYFEVHWLGKSNGYYSESVSYKIHQIEEQKES